MLIIGLTGGVASGKNLIAEGFKKFKIPVFDADVEVHKLLLKDKEIISQIKKIFPDVVVLDKIDKEKLAGEVFCNQEKLQNLEAIIYPKLRKKEQFFVKLNRRQNKKMVVLNIPLLFEKDGDKRCHQTIAVIADLRVRFYRFEKRLIAKGIKDKAAIREKFNQIINNQIDDKTRENRADLIIYNNLGKDFALKQLKSLLFGGGLVNGV